MNEGAKRPRLLTLQLLQGMGRFGLGFSLLSGEHIRLIQTESIVSSQGQKTLKIHGAGQALMKGWLGLSHQQKTVEIGEGHGSRQLSSF
jgi:hypothetical protein